MNFDSNYPIYLQIADDIKRRIIISELKPGDKLPSNSELAEYYTINPNTVQRVYKQLELENICYTRRGLGTFLIDDINLKSRLTTECVSKIANDFLKKMASLGFPTRDVINIINDINDKEDK
ncbi:MAG: GntR family transcriptional regulator [Oscillospiraceae bacterium]|nr:GntR family transcriptional regulator [Oscillospiraceae bacterium]